VVGRVGFLVGHVHTVLLLNETIQWWSWSWSYLVSSLVFSFLFFSFGWQRDPPVRGAGYEPFDSILCPNRSQKSQEISIRRSSNDVRTLRGQESRRAEFSPTRQHPLC